MKRKIIMSLILIILILLISLPNFAATEVRARKTGENVFRALTVSQSYQQCLNLKDKEGESLYGTNVIPHLTTNKDWGAVSYLAYSNYGINAKNKTGIQVKINGTDYLSTNGNITGIMDWGKNWTQTSSLNSAYIENPTGSENLILLEENIGTRLVEEVNTKNATNKTTTGMAITEFGNSYGSIANDVNYPVTIRQNLNVYSVAGPSGQDSISNGGKYSWVTFRPIVWNY